MLAKQVSAGTLPPLEERLPENPLVVEPAESLGNYGGEWHTATTGVADGAWLRNCVHYDTPLRLDPSSGRPQPNIVESFEANDTATEFTLTLRSGLKWSDGAPFTAADITFAVEDFFLDEDVSLGIPSWLLGGSELGTVEKVDDHTVTFRFPAPNGLLLQHLTTPAIQVESLFGLPRHYLEKFHQKYNPDIDDAVAEAGVTDWTELFAQKRSPRGNPEHPTIQPWRMVESLTETATRAVAERNPYYWKVDPEGRQLPYIDRVIFDLVSDPEAMLTRALNGDIDVHTRHFNNNQNKPVLARNSADGGYRLFDLQPDQSCKDIVFLNLAHKDPVKRETFQNKDFRIGLSYAINRQETIDVVYARQGEPYQAAPRPESEFYDEEFAKQYTEFDVELANEHLDIALPDKDDQGFRLDAGGNRFTFTAELALGVFPEWVDVMQLIMGYWREVGIDMRIQTLDRTLWTERVDNNDHEAVIWAGDSGHTGIALRSYNYIPNGTGRTFYAMPWAAWYMSGGESGEEPPEQVRAQLALYDEFKATADPDDQAALLREILQISKEQFYVLGISLAPEGYGIAKEALRNVPDTMADSVLYPPPGNAEPSQFFITDKPGEAGT